MRSPRRLLLVALAVLLVGGGVAAGTFASFTASTTNASSTFATGSLVLSNTKQSATACLSTGADNTIGNLDAGETSANNGTCNALFSALTANKPGDTATVGLTLKNEGNVTGATGITGYPTSCTGADAPDTGGATATVYHGSGNPCGYVTIQVQETSDAAFTTPVSKCMFPVDTGSNCASLSQGTRDAGTLTSFASTITSGSPMGFNSASVAAGASRYVKITLSFPNGSAGNENQYMGRTAAFGLTWTLTQ
ncbi:MAG: hypothetical protein JF603_09480 [Acidobacteria bacterium]|nr:hypothetical protein [Acidobacteriota bacterium]